MQYLYIYDSPASPAAAQPGLDSPKPGVEHVHPRSSIRSISGGADQEVLLDRHVADERQDEQRHTEHDEPERAGDPHHPASVPAAAAAATAAPTPEHRISARAGAGGEYRGEREEPSASHQQQRTDADRTRASRQCTEIEGRRAAECWCGFSGMKRLLMT